MELNSHWKSTKNEPSQNKANNKQQPTATGAQGGSGAINIIVLVVVVTRLVPRGATRCASFHVEQGRRQRSAKRVDPTTTGSRIYRAATATK